MGNLKTKFMGLELRNPLIIGSCNLSTNQDNLRKMEEAGAGAVVLKSLFEEQIQLESYQMEQELEAYNERNAEMTSLFPALQHAGPKEHLMMVKNAKKTVSIPVIASLNAVYRATWVEYAKMLEETGVDAIELNFYAVPRDIKKTGESVENEQVEIVKEVKSSVSVPVCVKLSPFYANPLNIISQMDNAGADGFVIFNRFFQPDIDLGKEAHISHFPMSSEEDNKLPMRFTGLLYGNIKAGICSNTGIQNGKDVIKMILTGADCVQVVGTLYKNKIGYITNILSDIESWMEAKKYKSVGDFRGKLSNKKINDPFVYKRAQYVDLLIKSDQIFKKDVMI
jgi:dihydroorotate dehydrogenase (fumarate)